jgi:hypothetical protein
VGALCAEPKTAGSTVEQKEERTLGEKRWPEHWTPEQAATCARARTEEKETKVLC